SGKEVFEWRGTSESSATSERDNAPLVTVAVIALDVRELEPKLQGVLAHQIRDVVLHIPVRVGRCIQRTALEAAEYLSPRLVCKTHNADGRESTLWRTRVDGVALAIGLRAEIGRVE